LLYMIALANRIRNIEEYYFSKKLQEVKSLDSAEFPVINLGIGSPDLPPAAAVIERLQLTAARDDAHAYQPYRGSNALREAIAAYYKRYYHCAPDAATEILPLMGSKEGIMHISMAFVNEGDQVLVPNPAYPTYSAVCRLIGAEPVYYDLSAQNNWQPDLKQLASMDLSRVKLMWINSPHMPTGSVLESEILKDLVQLARQYQFLLVNDNPYSMILNEQSSSILAIEGAKEVALELNSLSKSHNMAGWRIGWCIGNAQLIDAVLRVKSNMDSGMFLGLQTAAVGALACGPEWFIQLNATYAARKRIAIAIADTLGCQIYDNQSGLFVWAAIPNHSHSVEQLVDRLLYDCKVFITPGFIFGSNGEGHIRISLCATEEKLQEALRRVTKWMQQNG
jgi:LL-diaminopimelate aminotransferase